MNFWLMLKLGLTVIYWVPVLGGALAWAGADQGAPDSDLHFWMAIAVAAIPYAAAVAVWSFLANPMRAKPRSTSRGYRARK